LISILSHAQEELSFDAIYIDDCLVVGDKNEEIEAFLKLLQQEFKITIGSLENFLFVQSKRQTAGSIFLSQEVNNNNKTLQQRFNMAKAQGLSTFVRCEKAIARKMSVAKFYIVGQWAFLCNSRQQCLLTSHSP
jgi:hypothetical protein